MSLSKWSAATGLTRSSPSRNIGRDIPIKGGGADILDCQSMNYFNSHIGNANTETTRQVVMEIGKHVPISLTSMYRPTGTHQYGAVDVAPSIDEADPRYDRYARNRGFDPRLYARPIILKLLLDVMTNYPTSIVLVEDDHFHIQSVFNQGTPLSFPKGRVILQIRPRSSYKRTAHDKLSDARFINEYYWRPLTYENISTLPRFIERF